MAVVVPVVVVLSAAVALAAAEQAWQHGRQQQEGPGAKTCRRLSLLQPRTHSRKQQRISGGTLFVQWFVQWSNDR